jgi:hypothetical protein
MALELAEKLEHFGSELGRVGHISEHFRVQQLPD